MHQKRAAEAAFDEAFARYRGTVIGAMQNVADTLHALKADANALRASSSARQRPASIWYASSSISATPTLFCC